MESQLANDIFLSLASWLARVFQKDRATVTEPMGYFFEIIDPYGMNRQGTDAGEKHRTGVYSEDPSTYAGQRPTSRRDPTTIESASRCCRLPATSQAPRSTRTSWASFPTTAATSLGIS
ncbi:peptide-methionine (S)-S-oxide reductase [Adlercreutzia shanghongiae]|uniref:peptide-methionine (S)-S-oxide reductase n=1 Tax=Adlercreutzia shanghongiae TaxID=3111773 RepID=UPI003743FE5B